VTDRVRVALRLGLSLAAAALLVAILHPLLSHGPIAVHLTGLPFARRLPDDLRQPIELLRPQALYGLAVLPWFALFAAASLADLAPAQRVLSAVARSALLGLLLTALAQPTSTRRSARVCTVFLVDVSESVPDAAIEGFHRAVAEALALPGDHLARVVLFARRPVVLDLPARVDAAHPLPRFDPARVGSRTGTDLAGALSLAYGLFPADALRRVVVLSDGVQTEGDALAEAHRAARFGVRVSVVPSRAPAPAEVAIRELRLPDRIRVDEPFEARVSVFSTTATRATVTLYQGEAVNGLDGARTVDLTPGVQEVRFRSVLRVPGDVTYAARVASAAGDRFTENNRFATTATVPGRPTVLYVEGDAARAQWFRGALANGEFEVEVRGPSGIPQSTRELERFDFVVLSDVAAESVPSAAQDALTRYVRELGGGFLMAGGDHGFGLGGWQGTAVERLLPVRMESERRRDQPSLALALVIDRSGSMQGTPLLLAQSAALATARAMAPDDLLEVIAFDTVPERVVRMQAARNRGRIENELRRLRPGGGTAIFPAMDAAQQDLALTRAVTRHVILLTDGQGQPGEPAQLRVLVDAMSADGLTVSAVGLGPTVDRELLESLAHHGRGRSYFTADAHNLPQIFLRETTEVSRNAAVEDPVQPRVVGSAGFLRELRGAPPFLYGYVSTRAKPAPAQVLMATDSGEPLLARWRVGLGWSLAWTSDLKNRWAVEWIRWPRWSAFWSQLVREHMRTHHQEELGMHAEVVDGEVRASVDAIRDDDRFENGLSSEMVLRGPWPESTEQRVAMRQVGPGRYEARLPLARYGAFSLRAVHRRDGRVVAESRGRVDYPYPREYAALEPDLGLLTALASATGGATDPTARAMFDAAGESLRHRAPVWRYPVMLAVAVMLLDLLLRRVRIFDRGFKPRR
jgi:Ca-activated chloride channel homolog